jgi:hypothetical protein
VGKGEGQRETGVLVSMAHLDERNSGLLLQVGGKGWG